MQSSILPLLALAAMCGSSAAQSANIDFGPPTSPAADFTYGAGASQPGFWNQVPGGVNRTLLGLDGTTGVASIHTDTFSWFQGEIAGASGGDEVLMESVMYAASATGPKSLIVRDLAAGPYALYLYGWGSPWTTTGGISEFHVTIADGAGSGVYALDFKQQNWPGMQIENETYLRIPITLLPNADTGQTKLTVQLLGGSGNGISIIQGLQLVSVPAPAVPAVAMLATAWAVRRRR